MNIPVVNTCDLLVKRIESADIPCNTKRIATAWRHAEQEYEGKTHWTGIPLMDYAIGVLNILLPFQPDEEAIVACLLQHMLDCKGCMLTELEETYGAKTRELVSGAHLLSHVTLRDKRRSVEDLRLILLTVSDDIRTVLLILCDRAFLLECLPQLSTPERRQTAQDVLQLFAPVAARLGMYKLRYKLEHGAFPIVYPNDAERLTEQLQQLRNRYGLFLDDAAARLKDYLQGAGVSVSIEMRDKKIYSIFRKMQQKEATHVQQLYDLFAIRVIVQTESECYQVLGLLHKIGKPVANRFKDYIAFPKPNGYRSLHTTLMHLPGMEDESLCVEVQVRTQAMHHDAEYGVAAHWMYKERGSAAHALQQVQLRSMLSLQQPLEEEGESDALADHIYVLTPRGDLVELPKGATPLDFAFQLHTDLGLSFKSATVNGSIVSLDYILENGDIVDVLKNKHPQPSSHWMQLLKMASSRSKLKRYLYAQNRPHYVTEGREMVNEELKKLELPLLDTDLSLLRICDGKVLSMAEREDLLMKIGQRSERILPMLQRLEALNDVLPEKRVVQQHTASLPKSQTQKWQFEVEGSVPLPTRTAKCCEPNEWPHGPLMGVVGRAGVVVVHRKDCGMIGNANPERLIRVWWPSS